MTKIEVRAFRNHVESMKAGPTMMRAKKVDTAKAKADPKQAGKEASKDKGTHFGTPRVTPMVAGSPAPSPRFASQEGGDELLGTSI